MKKRHLLGVIFSLVLAVTLFLPSMLSSLSADAAVIPDVAEYNLEDTLIGGTFDEFAVGQEFGTSSVATFGWGTNTAYDYPAKVIDNGGNKMLKIAKGDGVRPYASAFVFIAKDFENEDIMTVEFEYKLDVEDLADYSSAALANNDGVSEGETIDFSFAPAQGGPHHVVMLDGTNPAMTTGENSAKWPVIYSDGANGEGWKKVSMTLIVNNGTLIANSLRWLMPVTNETAATDAMYLDNVKVIRWVPKNVVSKKPVLTSENTMSFDKKDPKDVTVTIDTKGLKVTNVKRTGLDNKVVTVNASAYTKTMDGDIATVVLKSDILNSLEVGDYTYDISTTEGTVSITLTVTEEGSGCGSNVISLSVGGVIIAIIGLVGLMIVGRKKSRKDNV